MPPALSLPASRLPLEIQIQAPPLSALKISVVVPVRDEEETLEATLTALARQKTAQGMPLDPACYEVLVLANNCVDASATLARRFARDHPHFALHIAEATLPPALANIGSARRLVMDEACRRLLRCGQPCGVIASTDGDTEVAADWLFQTLQEFSQGVEAVGGSIRTRREGDFDREARRYQQRDKIYQSGLTRLESWIDPDLADPWPRHHQFFGASLAITAEAYCRVGGLPSVPHLEDIALAKALERIDASVRHSPHVRVYASARQAGRTEAGLAVQLREWGAMGRAGVPHYVQQPAAVEARLHARAALRRWRCEAARGQWPGTDQVVRMAETLAVPGFVLREGLSQPHCPFGEWWAQIMERHMERHGDWARRWPLCEVTQALPDLKARLARYRSGTRSRTSSR